MRSPSPSSRIAPSASEVEGYQSVAPINHGCRITPANASGVCAALSAASASRSKSRAKSSSRALMARVVTPSAAPADLGAIRTSPYDLCANRSDRRQSREGDRWFESTSLQERGFEPPVPLGKCVGLSVEPIPRDFRLACYLSKSCVEARACIRGQCGSSTCGVYPVVTRITG